jgi:hypothetical protein
MIRPAPYNAAIRAAVAGGLSSVGLFPGGAGLSVSLRQNPIDPIPVSHYIRMADVAVAAGRRERFADAIFPRYTAAYDGGLHRFHRTAARPAGASRMAREGGVRGAATSFRARMGTASFTIAGRSDA